LAPPTGAFPADDNVSFQKTKKFRKSKPSVVIDYDAEAFHIKLVPPETALSYHNSLFCVLPKWTIDRARRRCRSSFRSDYTKTRNIQANSENDRQRLLDDYYVPGEWS
jgi:hypothetical protein